MPMIFVSYRRADAADAATRLRNALAARLGDDAIFVDVHAIEAGRDFEHQTSFALARTDVMLVVIGKRWNPIGGSGRRRLDDPHDYVRWELESVLPRGIAVVPLLLDGATMPAREELPGALKPLTTRHCLELSTRTWEQGLVPVLNCVEAELEGRRFAHLPAHGAYRLALEAQRHRDLVTARHAYRRAIIAAPLESDALIRRHYRPPITRASRAADLARRAELRLARDDLVDPGGPFGRVTPFQWYFRGRPAGPWEAGDEEEGESDREVTAIVDVAKARHTGTFPVDVPGYRPCGECGGTGFAPGRAERLCSRCQGQEYERMVLNRMPCVTCGGSGIDPACRCPVCDGQQATLVSVRYTIRFPKHVKNGTLLAVRGKGAAIDNVHPRARGRAESREAAIRSAGEHGTLYVRVETGPSAAGVYEYLDLPEVPPPPDPAAAILPGVGVAGIRFGDTPGRVTKRLGRGEVPEDYGKTTIREYPEAGIEVRFKRRHVEAFILYSGVDQAFRPWPGVTPEGIGVFATRREVERCYGAPDESEADLRHTFTTYNRRGLTFCFKTSDPGDLDARIINIWAFDPRLR